MTTEKQGSGLQIGGVWQEARSLLPVSKGMFIFVAETGKVHIMNLTISMNSVLSFLHSMSLSTSNKRWLADHLYQEVRAEERTRPVRQTRKRMTEKEKDDLFYSMAGAWKDDPTGDSILEAIHIGRQPASYKRELAYFEENE